MLYHQNILLLCSSFQVTFGCIFLQLPNGLIQGRLAPIPNSNESFYAFQEIPYAEPPIGNLRFQPPKPIGNWKGILDTTRNTKICNQFDTRVPQENEDCLYLNIYTPKLSKNSTTSLAVMVYLYGGGFIVGDATFKSYGPEFFMQHNVVIVTLNYRIGVYGFLSTGDGVVPENNGLKDQLLAMKWVNQNIHLFGGDPQKVTIFGQSAGAASVGYHLISQKSKGLFRAAILESGTPLCPWALQRNARSYAFKLASFLNSSVETSEELLELVMKASVEDIDQAALLISQELTYKNIQLFHGFFFAPTLEDPSDPEAFLTEKMYQLIAVGNASKVPIIIGVNSNEGVGPDTSFVFLRGLGNLFDMDVSSLIPDGMNVKQNSNVKAGEEIRQIYTGASSLANNPVEFLQYFSDNPFNRATIKHATLQSSLSDVYFYIFSYDGTLGNVTNPPGAIGVGHNEEIPYMWRVQSNLFDNYNLTMFPEQDLITQQRFLRMWTNFAKFLDPTPEEDPLLENTQWPLFKIENNLSYLNINSTLSIENNPKGEVIQKWEAIYRDYGNAPYDTY